MNLSGLVSLRRPSSITSSSFYVPDSLDDEVEIGDRPIAGAPRSLECRKVAPSVAMWREFKTEDLFRGPVTCDSGGVFTFAIHGRHKKGLLHQFACFKAA